MESLASYVPLTLSLSFFFCIYVLYVCVHCAEKHCNVMSWAGVFCSNTWVWQCGKGRYRKSRPSSIHQQLYFLWNPHRAAAAFANKRTCLPCTGMYEKDRRPKRTTRKDEIKEKLFSPKPTTAQAKFWMSKVSGRGLTLFSPIFLRSFLFWK